MTKLPRVDYACLDDGILEAAAAVMNLRGLGLITLPSIRACLLHGRREVKNLLRIASSCGTAMLFLPGQLLAELSEMNG